MFSPPCPFCPGAVCSGTAESQVVRVTLVGRHWVGVNKVECFVGMSHLSVETQRLALADPALLQADVQCWIYTDNFCSSEELSIVKIQSFIA